MLQIFEEHIKNDNPDIFHGQHCWISTALLTDYNIPVVCTIHGTDLMGYEKAKEILANVNSSKEDKENHGIGFNRVCEVVKEKNGIITRTVNHKIFTVEIVLPIES